MAEKNKFEIEVLAEDLASRVIKKVGESIDDIGEKSATAEPSFLKLTGAFAGARIASDFLLRSLDKLKDVIFGVVGSARDFLGESIELGGQLARLEKTTIRTILNTNEQIDTIGEATTEYKKYVDVLAESNTFGVNAAKTISTLNRTGLLPLVENLESVNGRAGFDRFILSIKDIGAASPQIMASGDAISNVSDAIFELNPQLLKQMGIQVDLTRLWGDNADQLDGLSGEARTLVQRQLLLSEVMKEAQKVQGAYNDAYDTSEKNLKSLEDVTTSLKTEIGAGLEPVVSRITFAMLTFGKGLRDLVILVKDQFISRFEEIQPILDSISEKWTTLTGGFENSEGIIEDMGVVIGNLITDTVINALSTFNGILQAFVDNKDPILEALNGLKESIFGVDDASSIATESAEEYGEELGTNLAESLITVTDNLTSFIDQLKDPDSELRKFTDGIIDLAGEVIQLASDIKTLLDNIKSVYDFVRGNTIRANIDEAVNTGRALLSRSSTSSVPVVRPPKFSNGADFIVPRGFNNDSFPMMVESGERVQVTPKGETTNNNNITINTTGGISSIDAFMQRLSFELNTN